MEILAFLLNLVIFNNNKKKTEQEINQCWVRPPNSTF